jgi:hypothetical protein
MWLNAGLIIFVIFLLVILSWVWPPDSPWSPWWRTSRKKARAAAKLANITSKDTVYELGSGDATFLLTCAEELGAKCVGIEIDPTRHLIAKANILKSSKRRRVKLIRANFFDVKISDASVIFVFLVPRVLEKLKPKLFRELKKNTKIVSYRYKFEPDTPSSKTSSRQGKKLRFVRSDTKNQIHLYTII